MAAANSPKSHILRMLVHKSICDEKDTKSLIGLSPCDVTLRPDSKTQGWPGHPPSAYGNWSLATYPLFYSSKIRNKDKLTYRSVSNQTNNQLNMTRIVPIIYNTVGKSVSCQYIAAPVIRLSSLKDGYRKVSDKSNLEFRFSSHYAIMWLIRD